mgnify:CR=1 FL=1
MKLGAQPSDKPAYFEDPAMQALYQMVLILGEELAATREQDRKSTRLNSSH